MTRAFIITYTISGNTDLVGLADELYEDLMAKGHNIESVKVYKERTAVPAALAFNPTLNTPAPKPPLG